MATKIPSDIILTLNTEAQEKEKQGQSVLNGTIGMMYLDNGKLPVSQTIKKVLSSHTKDDDLTYSSVVGTKEYSDESIHWFFNDSFNDVQKQGKLKTIATMGGTGACTVAIHDACVEEKSVVLIPKLSWPNYDSIAYIYNIESDHYDNFDNGHLNINSLSELVEKYQKEHRNITIIINDPCQNPTGFTMSKDDWMNFSELIEKASQNGNISIIYDCAYIDFSNEQTKNIITESLIGLSEFSLIYICMSFSKTFSFYGLRIGALGILSSDPNLTEAGYSNSIVSARTIWSTPNHMAVNVVSELLTDTRCFKILRDEVDSNSRILKNRARIFFEEAYVSGLITYPYMFGFFVSIPCKDSIKTANALRKRNVYIVPINENTLRVALSCIPTKQIYGLAKLIHDNL